MSRYSSNSGVVEFPIVPKNPIATYSLMATTYPTPLVGWTVKCLDDSRLYRFDGLLWEWIDSITTSSYDELVLSLTGDFDCGIFNDGNTDIGIDCGNF